MDKLFAAHIKENGKIQTIEEHLTGTAELAKKFANPFNSGEIAEFVGLYHDIGKYSQRFQTRIYEGENPVDHSTAGAIEINKLIPNTGFLLAYCIAGHHGGLPDGGSIVDIANEPTLYGRMRRTPEPYEKYNADLQKYLIKTLIEAARRLPIMPMGKGGFSVSFYIRMLFSCLVDGDFLDTETFMDGLKARGMAETLEVLDSRLDGYIKGLAAPTSEINKKRSEILNCCLEMASSARGLFSLTVPTGGGKTISSLAFALKHARYHGMERIIYIIPYNSIIEQNAAVFKEMIGEENVLEHHSNFAYDDQSENGFAAEQNEKYKLASENWDMPLIVTTSVQFFESLFSNKSSKCRKLHNLSNAIIIFDEAQMIPLDYLLPCVHSISELVHNYRSTVVLCSATQPNLTHLFPKKLKITEICKNTVDLYHFFKRTEITFVGELGDEELASLLNVAEQVLCIVNTRTHAQNLFMKLQGDGCYHLSTLMYPHHRKALLKEIRQRLKDGLPCRVVSTSLIEAGVDVDFPAVYRSEAGLDSIIQAAGRCNREANNKLGQVIVFKPAAVYRRHTPDMVRRSTEITNSIAHQFSDISSPEAIAAFFQELYQVSGEGIDRKKIVEQFERGIDEGFSFPFAKIASEFRLIDNSTRSIIIPGDDYARVLIERLKGGERNRGLLRLIQQYSVNIYEKNYQYLYDTGSIDVIDEELASLIDDTKYDEKTGLDIGTDTGIGIFV